jgi:hypothetical protein
MKILTREQRKDIQKHIQNLKNQLRMPYVYGDHYQEILDEIKAYEKLLRSSSV